MNDTVIIYCFSWFRCLVTMALYMILLLKGCVGTLFFKCFSLFLTDSEYIPLSVNDVKLITAGKILDNNRTLAESRLPVGVISTVHLLFPPPTLHKKSGTFFNTSVYIYLIIPWILLSLWFSATNHLILWIFYLLFHRRTSSWSSNKEPLLVHHFVAAS